MGERDGDAVAAPAARGLLTGWLAAKTVPRLIWLGVWAVRGVAAAAWGALAWRRARKEVLAGALDDRPDPAFGALPSTVVRERGIVGWVRGPGPRSP